MRRYGASPLLRRQIIWREENYPAIEEGGGIGLERFRHLLPEHRWELNFFPGLHERIRADESVRTLPAIASMMNPQVLSLNLILPFADARLRPVLEEYLAKLYGRTATIVEISSGSAIATGPTWPVTPAVPHLTITARPPSGGDEEILVLGAATHGRLRTCAGFAKYQDRERINSDPDRCRDFGKIEAGNFRQCRLVEAGWSGWKDATRFINGRAVRHRRKRSDKSSVCPCARSLCADRGGLGGRTQRERRSSATNPGIPRRAPDCRKPFGRSGPGRQ